MEGQEAAQLTVTVFSARSLQSKHKGDVCQASVVFGVGKDCYMTETITSCSPEWNQEARVNLPTKTHANEVKFRVRDKEHTLGVATISISSLSRHREGSKRWVPLTPHKRSHEAHGEIFVECFVSEVRPRAVRSEKASPNTSLTNSQEELHATHKGGGSGVVRGVKERFSFHRRNPSLTKVRTSSNPSSPSVQDKRLSGSDVELHVKQSRLGTYLSDSNLRMPPSPEHRGYGSEYSGDSVRSSGVENPLMPDVTGISPREGPVEGGQRVILRGSCLGECKSDVVRVVIADVDCTESLEYFSQSKLVVVTSARHTSGCGPVLIETKSGGVGISSLKFTFSSDEVSHPPEVSGISPREGPVEGGQRVILRGSCLGECKSDVVRVVIADVDCTETLEYLSPAKLVVTTMPCPSQSSGSVLVETVRGGIGESSLTFSYIASNSTGNGSAQLGVVKENSFSKKKQPEVDPAEFKAAKQQLRDLKEDNTLLKNENLALREYIDQLLLNVMEVKPDILEVRPAMPVSQSNNSFVS